MPASAENCTWTSIGADGRGLNADVLELGADDREEELMIEVHNADGVVARGSIPMVDLWQVKRSRESTTSDKLYS